MKLLFNKLVVIQKVKGWGIYKILLHVSEDPIVPDVSDEPMVPDVSEVTIPNTTFVTISKQNLYKRT